MSRWRWILTNLTRRLSVRATLIGLLGVAAAIIAALTERFIPIELPDSIGAASVETILTIMASSMLAVTTFSLSVVTAAYSAATNNVTPRATKLLMEDSSTQNVLSTFIGAFLFSMVGIVILETNIYGERGHLILFMVTVGVIILIVASLFRWINQLTLLGRVGETTDRVEKAAEAALRWRLAHPFLGGQRLELAPEGAQQALKINCIGYIQNIDMSALSGLAERLKINISLRAIPGSFIYPHTELAYLQLPAGLELTEQDWQLAQHAYTLAKERAFDQDPRFGLSVMCEIGLRALATAKDTGTTIDVLSRLARLMATWSQGSDPSQAPLYPRLYVPALQNEDLFEDAFALIARDAVDLIEVQIRLQKVFLSLGKMGSDNFRAAARLHSQLALQRAEGAMHFEFDLQRLRDAANGS